MSHRTKLIITTLFLVLLGIPTAYVALTWHPANPLRFRVVHIYPEWTDNPRASRMLCVAVENRSSAPVHLLFAKMREPGEIFDGNHPPGYIDPNSQVERVVISDTGDLVLPAKSVVHVTAFSRRDAIAAMQEGSLCLEYRWMSQIKRKASVASFWLREHSPEVLKQYVPGVYFGVNESPLEASVEEHVPPGVVRQ